METKARKDPNNNANFQVAPAELLPTGWTPSALPRLPSGGHRLTSHKEKMVKQENTKPLVRDKQLKGTSKKGNIQFCF